MGLTEYQKKRDFSKTPEPAGEGQRSESGRSFVVQKHDASRLHYDFRLELDGVLLSWAVPKGPSLDPGEKRLAVHVEDHPLAYGDFEGIIPEHQYGGGTVLLWDRGEWTPEGDPREAYRAGKLKFELAGEKLHGGWTLVRMGGKAGEKGQNWLLIKERDEAANATDEILESRPESVKSGRGLAAIAQQKDAVWKNGASVKPPAEPGAEPGGLQVAELPGVKKGPMPTELKPQLATLVKQTPSGDGWLHEIKFDGYRMLGFIDGGKARMVSRNNHDWTDRFSQLAEALFHLPVQSAIVDGEVVVLDERGVSIFQRLQKAIKAGRPESFHYYLFDLVHLDGYDLRAVPQLERKRLLEQLLTGEGRSPFLRYSKHIEGEGEAVYQNACRLALEGVIAKRAASGYETRRSKNWLKVKCGQRQEFVIVGYTDPSGSRQGFGALLLAVGDESGELRLAGKVGTGFTDAMLRDLSARLNRLERKTPPVLNPPNGAEARGVHWVTPKLVGEVAFAEWTADGALRHPSFQDLRLDRPADEVVREAPADSATVAAPREEKPIAKELKAMQSGPEPSEIAGVTLTSPGKLLYPDQGLTKSALARFYETIQDWILPHVVDRPLSLVRCPGGAGGNCFYQKHLTDSMPDGVQGVAIPEEDGEATYVMIKDLAGLVALVQMGVLEIHPWGSRSDRIERPDRMIFDLDPDPAVGWEDVVTAARLVREHLDELGLTSFVKTSGGKGLHVVAPLRRRTEWGDLKAFTRAVTERIAAAEPEKYVATMSKQKRRGKIFIDYLRNGRGATTVAAYSTRAKPGAPISTPVRWDELDDLPSAEVFTVANLPERLAELAVDPWADVPELEQSVTVAMQRAVGR